MVTPPSDHTQGDEWRRCGAPMICRSSPSDPRRRAAHGSMLLHAPRSTVNGSQPWCAMAASGSRLHSGQQRGWWRWPTTSQRSMHSRWNWWPQPGSRRTTWPRSICSMQRLHSAAAGPPHSIDGSCMIKLRAVRSRISNRCSSAAAFAPSWWTENPGMEGNISGHSLCSTKLVVW